MNEVLLTAIVAIVGTQLALSLKDRKLTLGGAITPSGKRPPFDALFVKYSRKYNIPIRDIVSVVDYESNFNPKAVNPEEDADRRKGRNVDSIGLGMILYPDTARDYDENATPDLLMEPDYNLNIACHHLARQLKRYPERERSGFPAKAVASYNAGSVRYKADGTYVNQVYVDRVRSRYDKWSGLT